jgi:hypothetical protein
MFSNDQQQYFDGVYIKLHLRIKQREIYDQLRCGGNEYTFFSKSWTAVKRALQYIYTTRLYDMSVKMRHLHGRLEWYQILSFRSGL